MKKTTRKTEKLPLSRLRELAVEAQADPRTVADVLAGGKRNGMSRQRIVSVLMKAGLLASLVLSLALSGCRDSSGAPVSGGLAFFSRPGTQDAVTPWQDADETSSHTLDNGGVRLDAGGRAVVYLSEPADIRVEASDGVTAGQFDDPPMGAELVQVRNAGFTGTDPVSGAQVAGGVSYLDTILSNLATSLGGADGLVKISASATASAIKTKFSNIWVDVKADSGALGNGVKDDTAAIQAAINYVASLGGGTVYFPPGTYLTSAAPTLSASVPIVLRGAGPYVSTIKNNNTTSNGFTVTGVTQFSFRELRINHVTASTGQGISASGIVVFLYLDNVIIDGYAVGVSVGAGGAYVGESFLTTSAASTSAALITAAGTVVVGGSFRSAAGIGIQVSGSATSVYGSIGGGGITFVDVLAGGSLYAHGAQADTGALGLRTAATASIVHHTACNWGTTGVTDARTGAPVNYVFAGANNVTPLPLQSDVIRVEQQTGAVVTTINNIAPIGFGREFTLICTNTSAGASTYTFGAAYVLSAAVAPAAGTRVALKLYYDPRVSKTFEVGRAATAN